MNPATNYRFGFVMEQILGHVTASKNLMACVAESPEVTPAFIPVEPDNPIGKVPVLGRNWSLRCGLHARALATRAAREHRLEALFFHTQITALFSVGLMRSVPSIVSLDATPINFDSLGGYGHSSNHGSLAERAKFEINRRAFNAARHLVTWNRWAKDSLISDYGIAPGKVHVLDPGIDTSLWALDEHQFDEARARPNILFVGADFARKGGPLLLDVFREHFRDLAQFQVVTRSPVLDEPGVTVHRDLKANDPRLRRLFNEADMLVLPTAGDTSPRVIAEAMVVRVPVISTRVAGIPEMVEDGVTGFLFDHGDGEALRQRIATLVGNPALRRSMGERGRQVALDRFDVRKNTGVLLGLLKGIARPAGVAAGA